MATKKPLSVDEGVKLNKKDSAVTYNTRNEGMIYNNNNTEVNVQIGGADRALVTKDQTQVLTNKSIDADTNTISNIEVDNLKAGVLDTDLSSVSLSDDTIPSAKATKDALDLKADGTDLSDHISDTTTHGTTGDIVGTTDTQSLTNKTIDSDLNTITNIVNADIKAGAAIDATKIHDGNVNNDEFSYLNGVTSSIQDQLNTKALDSAVVHNTGNENVAGVKTFTDTTESITKDTGAVIIEGGLGIEKNLNVGGNVVVTGNLQVDGTYTAVNSTNMEVTDPNIILNNGGNQASANSATAGFTVEMSDATDAVLGYDSTLASKFKCGEIGSLKEIADVSSIQSLTNKTLSGASIESPVRADVKKDTKANLETYALTASDGQLCFATDEQKMYQIVDNVLTVVGGGIGSVDVWAVVEGIDDVDTGSSNLVGGATVTESTDAILFTTGTTDGAYFVTIGYTPEIIIKDQNFFSFMASVSDSNIFNMYVQGYTGSVWEDVPYATTVEPLNASDRKNGLIVFDKGTYTQFRVKVVQTGTTAGLTCTIARGEWTDAYWKEVQISGEPVIVERSGNGGDDIFANVTDIPFGTGANRITSFTVPFDNSVIDLTGNVSGDYMSAVVVYVNGTALKRASNHDVGAEVPLISTKIVGAKKGDIVSLRSITDGHLNDSATSHHITFTATPIGTSKGIVAAAEFDRSQLEWAQYDIAAQISGVTATNFVAIPYKTNDGTIRVRGNGEVTFASATNKTFSIAGLTTAKSQAFTVSAGLGTSWGRGYFNIDDLFYMHFAAANTAASVWFDVEVDSMPSWATQPTVKPATIIAPVAVQYPTVEKILASNVATAGDIAGLTFTGLEIGAEYELTGQVEIESNAGKINTLGFFSGASATGDRYGKSLNYITVNASTVTAGVSLKFVAQSATLYANKTGTTQVVGDGTKSRTFLQLTRRTSDSGFIASSKEEIHKHATYLSSNETEAGWSENRGKKIYKRSIYFPSNTTTNATYLNVGTNITPVKCLGFATDGRWTIAETVTAGSNTDLARVYFDKTTGYVGALSAGGYLVAAGTELEFFYTKD